jgi:hypothetical protein
MFSFGIIGHLPGGTGGGGGGVPTVTPKVTSSIIRDDAPDGIIIQWDTQVEFSQNIKGALTVKIDGVDATINEVIYDPQDHSRIGIILNVKMLRKQVVTWAYDDQNPTEYIKGSNDVEAENQTYAVTNNIKHITADETTHTADITTHTADEGVA